MRQILSSRITRSVFPAFVLFVCAARAQATDISGTISTTFTIFEDSELVGDVTCMVAGAPCIAFGAPGIQLRLNGFTITDGANPSSNCASSSFTEDGIQVNAQLLEGLAPSVMVKPFRRNWIPGAPNAMHGAPATIQVTSPTSSLSSKMVNVVEMVPLMSVAWARAAQTTITNAGKTERVILLERIYLTGPPYAVLRVAI